MAPVIIVDNEYITLQYLPDKKTIHHTIHQPIPNQALKDALDAGTKALRENGGCKWLSDDRKNGPLSDELQAWGTNHWIPLTIAAGWKYWANVVPEGLAAAGTLVEPMRILFDLGLRMMVFTHVDEAMRWLDGLEC